MKTNAKTMVVAILGGCLPEMWSGGATSEEATKEEELVAEILETLGYLDGTGDRWTTTQKGRVAVANLIAGGP